MDISGYVERLRVDLVAAASSGGDEMVDAAERLATTLDAAVRMALLEALADATAEITAELDGRAVELRLRGRDPEFVVSPPPPTTYTSDLPSPGDEADDDGAIARITLRLPETLKQQVEDAAAGARQSVNTWLVDAVRDATRDSPHQRVPPGRRLTGWAR
ncbi:toxin-antitoxin system HicB family antitoxin [soil metagenome]